MNEILLYGDIYSFSASEIVRSIGEVEGDNLSVRVNTNGGEPEYGWGIISKMLEFQGNVTVKNDGKAYSMGAFLFAYFDETETIDTAQFLIHRAAYPQWFEESAYFTDDLKSNLSTINASLRQALESKIDVQKFEKTTKNSLDAIFSMDSRIDVFLTAKQAKDIGLVKNIVQITPKKKKQIQSNAMFVDQKIYARFQENENEVVNAPTSGVQVQRNSSKKMNLEELRAQHPELVAQITDSAIKAERDRVGSWLKYSDVDAKAVATGIESGAEISATQREDFNIKIQSKVNVAPNATTTIPNIETPEAPNAPVEKTAMQLKIEALKLALKK